MILTQYKLSELWNQVLQNIQKKDTFDSAVFKSYLKESKLVDINHENCALVEVQWDLQRNFFNNYIGEFENELSNILNETITLKVVVSGEDTVTPHSSVSTKLDNNAITDIFKTANHISKFYTFDNFIQGSSNEKSYAAAYGSAISSEPNFYNPIFIYGNSGLGKTHLLHAICNYLKDNRGDEVTYLYIDGNDLIAELINATKNRTVNQIIERLSYVDYLLIDDIQHLAKTNDTQEVFFNLYNKIIDNEGQIIMTSDVYPSELKSMNNRLISRFTSGLSVCIDPPEFSTAVSILNKKISLSKQKLNITDDAISYIAKNYSSDVRQLEGAFNDILFNSILFKAELIDLDFVKDVLKEKKPTKINLGNNDLTPKIIKREVCNFYNITMNQIESKSRTLNISNPRKIAIYLCRELLNMPYEKIGKEFGNRDHSTIMSNYNNFVKMMESNDEYKESIEKLKEILSA